MDEQIIKRFKTFQRETKRYLDLEIEILDFDNVCLTDNEKIFFNPPKSELFNKLIQSDSLVSFIPMSHIDEINGVIAKLDEKNIKSLIVGSYRHFETGDILFAKVTPCMENGNCAIAENLKNGVGFGSSEFYVFRGSKDIFNKYLWFFLRQETLREKAKLTFTGQGGLKRVPKSFFETTYIQIPKSLNEKYTSIKIQEILVEFIEHYSKRNDSNLQIVNNVSNVLVQIEKAVLPLFFQNHQSVAKKFDKYCIKNNINLKLSDIEFETKRIISPNSSETICNKRMGFTPKCEADGDINWFTVGDLSKNNSVTIDIPETKSMTNIDLIRSKVGEKSEKLPPIKKGDVLVSFKLTVGVVKIYNSELPAYCNEAIDILTPNENINSYYLAYNCKVEYPKYGERTNNGITLNDDHKKLIEINIPKDNDKFSSLEIQKIIVDFTENYLLKINTMNSATEKLQTIIAAHSQTITYKTFNS